MTELLLGDAFNRLFTSFERTAFRLELRDRYAMPDEQDRLDRFLATGEYDDESRRRSPWLDTMRAAADAGKSVTRVRIVTEPHSDYTRYSAAGTHHNIEAGEDIRWLPRDQAKLVGLDVPDVDYWLFDDLLVAHLHFDDEDRFLGAELDEDPAALALRRRWRDIALRHAIPHEIYGGR